MNDERNYLRSYLAVYIETGYPFSACAPRPYDIEMINHVNVY
jgi:hypothetical protein